MLIIRVNLCGCVIMILSNPIFQRLLLYALLIRAHRPIGTVLLAWPALWSIGIVSRGETNWLDLSIVILCAFLTRSAGCAINDWSDRGIDGLVQRTQTRPLATGALHAYEALVLAGVLLLMALALSFFLTHSVLWLLPPTVALIVFYPFTKRFFVLPQLVLALTFAMAVPIAWYAVVGQFSRECWLLMTVTVVWVFAYDTVYALCDRADDSLIGIHSSALFFGALTQPVVGFFHLLLLAGLWLLGEALEFGYYWYLAMAVSAVSIIYQHYLISRARTGDFLRAFTHNGWFGLIIWLGLVLQWL